MQIVDNTDPDQSSMQADRGLCSPFTESRDTVVYVDEQRMPRSGPRCSKLTMSLVNDSLKFTSSDTQIC